MSKAHPIENDVKGEIRKLLDLHGWHHWPAAASRFGVGGISDRLAVRGRPGLGCIFLAIEAKLDKDHGTPLQEDFLENVRRQGGIGIVVNRAKLPKFKALLEAISAAYPLVAPVRYWRMPDATLMHTEGPGSQDGAEEIDEATYLRLLDEDAAYRHLHDTGLAA